MSSSLSYVGAGWRERISLSTNLAVCDADPYGDGDQTPFLDGYGPDGSPLPGQYVYDLVQSGADMVELWAPSHSGPSR